MSGEERMCGGPMLPEDAEATLRLVASLRAPEGLEERVNAALLEAASGVAPTGRVLEFRTQAKSNGPWMRSAAAAAIAFVVVGGGWGVYSRVQTARVIPIPARVAGPGEFSSSGARRTPQTVHGPAVPPAAGQQSAPVVTMPEHKKADAAKKTQTTQAK